VDFHAGKGLPDDIWLQLHALSRASSLQAMPGKCGLRAYRPKQAHELSVFRMRATLPNQRLVEQRPPIVLGRAWFGNWEGDLVMLGGVGSSPIVPTDIP
jgi:IS30 family transposase